MRQRLITATATLQDAEEINRLLDPGYTSIETVSGGTRMTPNLRISIIRTGTQSRPGTTDAVRDAVEFVERSMQLPLPIDHVIVVLNEKAVTKRVSPAPTMALPLAICPSTSRGKAPSSGGISRRDLSTKLLTTTGQATRTGLTRVWPTSSRYQYGGRNRIEPGAVENPA